MRWEGAVLGNWHVTCFVITEGDILGKISFGARLKYLYRKTTVDGFKVKNSLHLTDQLLICESGPIDLRTGWNVKWSRYRPGVAQTLGRGIALLFHDRGTRRGWVVSSTLRSHFTPGKDPVPVVKEAGWAPGPVWTGGKSRPHRDSIPDRPACSSVALPTELPNPGRPGIGSSVPSFKTIPSNFIWFYRFLLFWVYIKPSCLVVCNLFLWLIFLGTFVKLRKAAVSFLISVCLNGWIFMKIYIRFILQTCLENSIFFKNWKEQWIN